MSFIYISFKINPRNFVNCIYRKNIKQFNLKKIISRLKKNQFLVIFEIPMLNFVFSTC